MKNAIYTMEQVQQITGYLDTMVLTGVENFKRAALIANIIEKPIEVSEEEGVKNES